MEAVVNVAAEAAAKAAAKAAAEVAADAAAESAEDSFAAIYAAASSMPGLTVKMPETTAELYRVGVVAMLAVGIVFDGTRLHPEVVPAAADPIEAMWHALAACGVQYGAARLELTRAFAGRLIGARLAKYATDWTQHAITTCVSVIRVERALAALDELLTRDAVLSALGCFREWVRANTPPEVAVSAYCVRYDLVVSLGRVASARDIEIVPVEVAPAAVAAAIEILGTFPTSMLDQIRTKYRVAASRPG